MVKVKVTSLENASILRKFTIIFVLMSLLPIGILYYIYYQIKETGRFEITEQTFGLTFALVIIGVLIGYALMRAVLNNIVEITRTNQETLVRLFGPSKVKELTENGNEISMLARSFSEMTNRLEENIKNLELSKKTLHSVLARVGRGISSLENIDSFLELIVETMSEALSAKIGVLMLIDEEKKGLYIKTVYGITYDTKNQTLIKTEDEPFRSILLQQKSFIVSDLKDLPPVVKEYSSLFQVPCLGAPLTLHEKNLGIIFVSGKNDVTNFKREEEMNLLYNLASQTAVAIENSHLNADAEKTYFETISALALAVEAKDHYSRGHLDRVSDYAIRIARKFNLSEEDMKVLRDGARLHDLGKIGILDEILKKPDQLNPQEWEMMKKHTVIGEGIIKPIRSLSKLCDIVRHHHEKLDGSGYPDGLKGDEISLLSRILCVADIFDALTTNRPYRKAFTSEEAKQELIKMKGKLDPKVVDALLQTL